MKFKPELYWLLHHDVLLESTTEPIEARIAYIQMHKHIQEIALRLEWMRKVQHPDLLPEAILRACADRDKEYAYCEKAEKADWDKACADRDKSDAAWLNALRNNWSAVVARHKAECPGCPFDYKKQKTLIFPEA